MSRQPCSSCMDDTFVFSSNNAYYCNDCKKIRDKIFEAGFDTDLMSDRRVKVTYEVSRYITNTGYIKYTDIRIFRLLKCLRDEDTIIEGNVTLIKSCPTRNYYLLDDRYREFDDQITYYTIIRAEIIN